MAVTTTEANASTVLVSDSGTKDRDEDIQPLIDELRAL